MANKKIKMATPYSDWLIESLRSDEDAQRGYLMASFRDNADMPSAILRALRNVAEARGFAKVAKQSGLSRESLYKTLSADGNPKIETLYKILNSFGLRLSVETKRKAG